MYRVENGTGIKELRGVVSCLERHVLLKKRVGVGSARQVWQGNATQLGVQEKFTVSKSSSF